MEAKGIEALKARFAGIEVKANPKTMDEIVEYIETKWQGQRVKIKESEYIIHYKNALEFMKRLGKPIEGVQEEIRRYMLPNRIGIVLGMKSEYITVEDGMKYYQALTVLKGLTQEDIDTKNDRWLQYMMMLEMQAEWDAREAAAKAAEEAEVSGSEQTGGNKVTKYAATFLGVLALVGLVAGGGIYTFMKQKQKKQAEKEALDPDANYTEDKGDFEIPVEDEPEETGEEDNAEE